LPLDLNLIKNLHMGPREAVRLKKNCNKTANINAKDLPVYNA